MGPCPLVISHHSGYVSFFPSFEYEYDKCAQNIMNTHWSIVPSFALPAPGSVKILLREKMTQCQLGLVWWARLCYESHRSTDYIPSYNVVLGRNILATRCASNLGMSVMEASRGRYTTFGPGCASVLGGPPDD